METLQFITTTSAVRTAGGQKFVGRSWDEHKYIRLQLAKGTICAVCNHSFILSALRLNKKAVVVTSKMQWRRFVSVRIEITLSSTTAARWLQKPGLRERAGEVLPMVVLTGLDT